MGKSLLLLGLLAPGHCLRVQEGAAPRVPFYMYELPAWTQNCGREGAFSANWYPDYALYETLKGHPWRVRHDGDAKLFVVPGYFSMSAQGECGGMAANMQETVAMLKKHSFFEKRLREHLFSCAHWRCTTYRLGAFGHYAEQMIWAHFENAHPRNVVTPYGPVFVRGVEHLSQGGPKSHSLFMVGQADKRLAYHERAVAIDKLPAGFEKTFLRTCSPTPWMPLPECQRGKVETRCKMRRSYDEYVRLGTQSKYNLVIHGDTPSTSRLYDAISFEQLPIFVSDGWHRRAAPFPKDVPWEEVMVSIGQHAFNSNPVGSMREAVQTWEGNSSKQELWKKVGPLLDWSLGSACMGMALLSDVGRRHLQLHDLPPAWQREECRSLDVASLRRMAKQRVLHLNETRLKEALMEGRLD